MESKIQNTSSSQEKIRLAIDGARTFVPLLAIGGLIGGLYFLGQKAAPFLREAMATIKMDSETWVQDTINDPLAQESIEAIGKDPDLSKGHSFLCWKDIRAQGQLWLNIKPFDTWLNAQPKITVAFTSHKGRLDKWIIYIREELDKVIQQGAKYMSPDSYDSLLSLNRYGTSQKITIKLIRGDAPDNLLSPEESKDLAELIEQQIPPSFVPGEAF